MCFSIQFDNFIILETDRLDSKRYWLACDVIDNGAPRDVGLFNMCHPKVFDFCAIKV